MTEVKFGDIIEINIGMGLAYAIYTHKHDDPPRFGALLHIFHHLFIHRPSDMNEILCHPIQFSTFFPLQAAVNRGLVGIIGNTELPLQLQNFPMFRCAGLPDPKTKKVTDWWLWDGRKEWKIGKLSSEQRKLPIRCTMNDTMLKDKIKSGWTSELDER